MNKIVARRVNKATEASKKHYTLKNVINQDRVKYGFAMADDGIECFIPYPVILRENMTKADIGAGFTAPSRPAPDQTPRDDGTPPSDHIALPIEWDGAAEIIDATPGVDGSAEMDEYLDTAENLVTQARAEMDKLQTVVKEATNVLDNVIAQTNILDNAITAVEDHLAED